MIEEQAVYATKFPLTLNFTNGGLKQPGGPQEGQYPKYIRKIPNYWLRPGWFAAHDIPFPGKGLKCNQPIVDETTGGLTGAAPWIMDTVKSTLRNDYYNPEYQYKTYGLFWSYQSCQADPQRVLQQETIPLPYNLS